MPDLPIQSPPGIKINENPIIVHARTKPQPFLVYGLHTHRNLIIEMARYHLRDDSRYHYITIDNFNNPAILPLIRGKSFDDMSYSMMDKATQAFAIENIDLIKTHLTKIKRTYSEKKGNRFKGLQLETALIRFACNSALEISKHHNIKIFFILDGINWDNLQTKYKDTFTTRELQSLFNLFQNKSDLSHITFMEDGKILSHDVVFLSLKKAFQTPLAQPDTAHYSRAHFFGLTRQASTETQHSDDDSQPYPR